MPEFPIVDAHVHLYDPGVISYGWMRGKPVLDSRQGVGEFDLARGAIDVEVMVWIEVGADPGQHQREARWAGELVERDPRIKGLVAHVPLEQGTAVEADLERLLEHRRLKGIRRLLQDEPDDAFCLRPGFVKGIRLLARYDLSFDICVYHRQLASALELVRRCPEVRFVLDHIGKPAIRDALLEPWRTQIAALAALPNVWCKISGVITEAGDDWTQAQLSPYLDHVLERFGCERLMFGSDWPVSELTHRYADWVETVERALGGTSDSERRRLFRDTAIAFYRLDRP